jgi:LacI family transcriptional regulator
MANHLPAGRSLHTFVYRERDPSYRDGIAAWLARERPDVAMGMFGTEVFDQLGWQVPKDIARVTFDRSPGFPEHAGLEMRYEALGALAADVLTSEVILNRRGLPQVPVEYTVPCQWVNGRSAPSRR